MLLIFQQWMHFVIAFLSLHFNERHWAIWIAGIRVPKACSSIGVHKNIFKSVSVFIHPNLLLTIVLGGKKSMEFRIRLGKLNVRHCITKLNTPSSSLKQLNALLLWPLILKSDDEWNATHLLNLHIPEELKIYICFADTFFVKVRMELF